MEGLKLVIAGLTFTVAGIGLLFLDTLFLEPFGLMLVIGGLIAVVFGIHE